MFLFTVSQSTRSIAFSLDFQKSPSSCLFIYNPATRPNFEDLAAPFTSSLILPWNMRSTCGKPSSFANQNLGPGYFREEKL